MFFTPLEAPVTAGRSSRCSGVLWDLITRLLLPPLLTNEQMPVVLTFNLEASRALASVSLVSPVSPRAADLLEAAAGVFRGQRT